LQLDEQVDQTKSTLVFNSPDLISPLQKYTLDWLDQFFAASRFAKEGDTILARCNMIEDFEEHSKAFLNNAAAFHKPQNELKVI
jgi:hypothetical protein